MLAVYAVALSATQNTLRESGTITGILTKGGSTCGRDYNLVS